MNEGQREDIQNLVLLSYIAYTFYLVIGKSIQFLNDGLDTTPVTRLIPIPNIVSEVQ